MSERPRVSAEGASDLAPAVLLNKQQMAAALRVSVPTLDRMIADGCPVEVRGDRGSAWQFDPVQVLAWRDEQETIAAGERARQAETVQALQDSLDLRGADSDVPHLSLKARREYYDAEARRIELDRQRGFLVETHRVRAEMQAIFAELADWLRSLPDHLERRVDLTPDQVEALERAIEERQTVLAERMMREEAEIDAAE